MQTSPVVSGSTRIGEQEPRTYIHFDRLRVHSWYLTRMLSNTKEFSTHLNGAGGRMVLTFIGRSVEPFPLGQILLGRFQVILSIVYDPQIQQLMFYHINRTKLMVFMYSDLNN